MTKPQSFLDRLHSELLGENLVHSLFSGGLMGFTEVFMALSLSTLIFSGPLTPYLPVGLGVALFAVMLILITTALFTSLPGLICSVQDSPSVLLAVIAAGLVAEDTLAQAPNLLATVLVTLALATLLTGAFLLLMGVLNLGGMVRYIPYPVVGGFLAGTGLLLLQGSIGIMADFSLTLANLSELFSAGQLILWLPGVVFAVVLFFGLRMFKHSLAMPLLLIVLVLSFYLILVLSGTSIETARQMGLLLGDVGRVQWAPLTASLFHAADWGAILGQADNMVILMVISLVSLLLNATGIELALGEDVDLNQELRALGIANLSSGLSGGFVGYHVISLTILGRRLGGRGRLPGIAAGLVVGAFLFIGADLLAYFPKALLGGLVMFMGIDFLTEWVFKGWRRFSLAEYGVVLLIMIVIVTIDFLVGVGVGLAAMIIIFVVRYSRINSVHHILTGQQVQSNVERPAHQRRMLVELGDAVYVMVLQGYLFFGSAHRLLEQFRRRIETPDGVPPRFIIFDFLRVNGLDASAALSFVKVRQLAEARQIVLVLTSLSRDIKDRLQLEPSLAEDFQLRIFPDLDTGLEWCEDQLMLAQGLDPAEQPDSLIDQLIECYLEEEEARRLQAYLELVELAPGDYLVRQGEKADSLFFIESGRLSVYLEKGDGGRTRLRTIAPGSSVGEMGLYLDQERVASVIAEEYSRAFRLSLTALARMKTEQPGLAAAFHEMIACQLSEFLTITTAHVNALSR